MKPSPFMRICSIALMLMIVVPLYGQRTWFEIHDLNTGLDLSNKATVKLKIFEHQVYGLEFIAHYENDSPDTDFEISLTRHPDSEIPEYVEGWQDEVLLLPAGRDTTLKRTIFIRPLDPAADVFSVVTMLREGPHWSDPGWRRASASVFEVAVETRELDSETFTLPVLVFDDDRFSSSPDIRKYTRGLTNRIVWSPASGDESVIRILQDGYAFDLEDPQNLIRSVKSLYKTDASAAEESARFDGLADGRSYGYFVKAIYETDDGSSLILYSDFIYSTQDDRPPETIDDAHAVADGAGNVRVWWRTVEDGGSGMSHYRIYRAEDTGIEVLIDSVAADAVQPPFMVWEETVSADKAYHYRIRAVDVVGNEGDGVRTEGVGTDDPSVPDSPVGGDDPTAPEDGAGSYIRGPVDTLWLEPSGWETEVRFIAARDDTSLFATPTVVGMRRFDSEWIPIDSLEQSVNNPAVRYWRFDYSAIPDTEDRVDLNFVDNHVYHRWMIRRSSAGYSETTYLGPVIPDCFPPEDVHNLQAVSVLDSGTAGWRMSLSWQPATDGASGLKTYHIHRRIQGIDDDFSLLTTGDEGLTMQAFVDGYSPENDQITNPYISYRVTGEDWVGNRRGVTETVWEAGDRALNAPVLAFADTTSPDVFQYRPDTLITKQEEVLIRLMRFDIADVVDYAVSINGTISLFENEGVDVLNLPLPADETVTDFHIRVRARYPGERSSLWSKQVVIIREGNRPPSEFTALNEAPDIGTGDILLKWGRPSLDVVDYEVWRWDESGAGKLAAVVRSTGPSMEWIDAYGIEELTGQPGDTLVAFEMYTYRVRVVNLFNDTTAFSASSSVYCRKAPELATSSVEKRNDEDVIVVSWNRALPTQAVGTWNTRIRVSVDSLSNLVRDTGDDGMHVVDDTVFIYDGVVEPGHNYIFQIKEIPRPPTGRESHWSLPFTVNLARIDSLFAQAQPGGAIYVTWEADTLLDVLSVDAFEVMRIEGDASTRFDLPGDARSFMDSEGLVHGKVYTYRVSALNEFGQVVAMNSVEAISDTGFVFVPIVDRAQYFYFNSDSITVNWHWENFQGITLPTGTQGAVDLMLELSVSRLFPEDAYKTRSTGWFDARREGMGVRSLRVGVPDAVGINNETVYCRITARDRWGLPSPPVWSETVVFVYDVIRPHPVETAHVVTVEAFYGKPDSVMVELAWDDASILHPDRRLANVDFYRIVRTLEGVDEEVGVVPVEEAVSEYQFRDTLANRLYAWRIVSIDSARNSTDGIVFGPDRFSQTPAPPIPTGFRSCTLQPVEEDTGAVGVESFVEIALDPDHFLYAYEINILPADRLLCQSGWITDMTFTCGSGWGAVSTDTTWFRVKVRRGEGWESGWSSISYYTEGGGGTVGQTSQGLIPEQFEVFPAYPNPFNATTVIPYRLPETGRVLIAVFDVRGAFVKAVVDAEQIAGAYTASWNGTDRDGRAVPSGMYFIRVVMSTEDGRVHRERLKAMLVK